MSTLPGPGSLHAWWLACRPKTLTAAWSPVMVGTAFASAEGAVVWPVAIAALLGASLLQIGSNFANDVFDYEKGADDEHRLGPTRAVQAGLVSPRAMKIGMAVCFAFATLVGVYLTSVGGWPIVGIGIASILSAIAYTGGPYPLGYNGLGDVFVMLFFGLIAVCCTTWLQVGTVPLASVFGAIGVGALATNILVVNNVRDAQTDAVVGKRTLIVRFGRAAGIRQYAVLLVVALAVPFALLSLGYGLPVLAALLTAPVGLVLYRQVRDTHGLALNPLLGKTAALVLLYSVTLSAGVVLGAP